MSKIIYHGSQNRIETPQYGVGKLHNDYGLGFYCADDSCFSFADDSRLR